MKHITEPKLIGELLNRITKLPEPQKYSISDKQEENLIAMKRVLGDEEAHRIHEALRCDKNDYGISGEIERVDAVILLALRGLSAGEIMLFVVLGTVRECARMYENVPGLFKSG